MKVSVIIPTYNEGRDIANCLKSLEKQSYKNFEIIVVDDGSIDKTLEIAKKFKDVRILKQNHKGSGLARNLGARNAKGNILVLIDADMTFDKDYLKNLITPILKDKEIIGTTHDCEIATNTENWISNLWGKVRVSKENAKDVKIFRAIRKDNFFEFGGFDQKYGYADDQTFWFEYGIKPTVAKNTICYHKNPETLKGSYKQARWIGASWKERFGIFRNPLLNYILSLMLFFLIPFITLFKAIKIRKYSFADEFKFYFYKFLGYGIGVFRAVYFGRVWK